MAVSQEKISVHSLPDLKNTSDDAIPTYLNSLKFKQSHTLSDIRLGLGYTAFAICAACFYWDYTYGFEDTKSYTAVAVALYTLLNGALTYWIWGVEKGVVYVGVSPNGEKIELSTKIEKKYSPIYEITVRSWGKNGKEKKPITIKRSFTKWFDAQGHFVSKPFQQMFASNVEVIGMLDQANIVRGNENAEVKKVEIAPKDASMEEKWASLLAESAPGVTGVQVEDGKASVRKGKGRKKA